MRDVSRHDGVIQLLNFGSQDAHYPQGEEPLRGFCEASEDDRPVTEYCTFCI